MRIDRLTGEPYDADEYYRGAYGLWHSRSAEKQWAERQAKRDEERRAKRNASRVARGKRKKSKSEFVRATRRFSEYLHEAAETMAFGDWLRMKFGKRRFVC